MRTSNAIGGGIWLSIAGFIVYESTRLGVGELSSPGAGLFPFLTGIALGVFSLVCICDALWRREFRRGREEGIWASDADWKKVILTFLAMVVYALLLETLGYVLGTLALMLFLLRKIERTGWPVAVAISVISVAVSYLLFGVWLQVQLPVGLFANLIG